MTAAKCVAQFPEDTITQGNGMLCKWCWAVVKWEDTLCAWLYAWLFSSISRIPLRFPIRIRHCTHG